MAGNIPKLYKTKEENKYIMKDVIGKRLTFVPIKSRPFFSVSLFVLPVSHDKLTAAFCGVIFG